jgi:hypothetical protein
MYEYGTLEPIKVSLRREEGTGRIMAGMNQVGV